MGRLGREISGKKKGGVARQTWNNQDKHNGNELTSMWKNVDLKVWVNLSYKI